MKKYCLMIFLAIFGLMLLLPKTALAGSEADLYIREINITGSEFIVLGANTAIAHLNSYWLGYISDDASLAGPSEQLPDVTLNSGQSIILNSGAEPICDFTYAAKLPFSSGFSNSKGTVSIWLQNGTSFTQTESVSWGSGSYTLNGITGQDDIKISLGSSMTDPVWYYDSTYGWVVGNFQNCSLANVVVQSGGPPPSISWPVSVSPPVTIASLADTDNLNIPAADIGLAGPVVNEVLPNPASPQTDADDEFIELYNPNSVAFDLSGFSLEIGLTTKHDYTFDAGITLPAHGFTAFHSADTGLSLSNSGGQVWLLDPDGNIVSQTDAYGTAKDGQAWALASGKWYWTSTPTPGAANTINGSTATQTSKTKTTPVSGSNSVTKTATGATASSSNFTTGASANPPGIHPLVLAAVGTLALAYAAYEYRYDLANRLYQLRRYREARRTNRRKIGAAGSAGAERRFRSWQNHVGAWLSARLW